jgi:hypothetical protein
MAGQKNKTGHFLKTVRWFLDILFMVWLPGNGCVPRTTPFVFGSSKARGGFTFGAFPNRVKDLYVGHLIWLIGLCCDMMSLTFGETEPYMLF